MDLCLEEFLFGIRDKRFTFFPTAAGLHHYFLDTFYKQYFLENSNEMRQKMAGRIAIYTHIYLLERKIEQNKEKFEKMDANLIMEGQLAEKMAPRTVSVYDKLSGDIQRVLNVPYNNFSKYALSPGAIRQMCYLLLIKHGLLIASNFDSKIHVPDLKPSCYNLEVAYQSVLQRDEQISEWILSDLMMFLPKHETSKWRAKISLEKILYDELLLKALEEQTKTLTELELPKQNWRKASKAKELLIAHRNRLAEMAKEYEMGKEESLMHLFENGPVDVSLPGALAFCVPVALAEFDNTSVARQTHQTWLEKLQSVQIKMLICVGRHLKSANRRDEMVAKLHLEKMMAILEEENDETDGPFKGILIKHKESFGTILNKDGIQKINEWLNHETKYFSLNEKFSSAASSSDDEQRFKDANYDEQIDEDNETINNNSWSSVYERSQYRLIRTSAESLEKDLKMSQEINEFIEPYSIKQSKRAEIGDFNGQIQQIIEEWIQNIPIANTDDKKVPKTKLLRNGSFLMNSELDGSDLDLICVVPDQINISHFHSYNGDNLYSLLKRKITDGSVSWRPGRVPLIRIERGQIEADLLLVPVPDKNLSDEADLDQLATDQMITELKTESGIYSLAGYQSAKFQLALVQSESMLSSLLKIVKVWAKTRLIYSGLFGFFNGITLSIMATQICVLFPNSPVSFLLFQFFEIYAKWDWPNVPIMLKQLTPNKLNKIVGRFWPPINLGQSLQSSMTIITPSFPEQNAAFNVNPFTMRTIIEELKIASEILAENPQKWKRIFKEINYEEKFVHFALIVCSQSVAFDFDSYSSNCAYQKSRLRQNLLGWANSVQAQLDNYHLIPKFEQKTTCNILK
ncbi:hypothetical protein niasHS_007703 [Heterodera schachtii]|uniref:polynucleotide adenylyltransferase n=1 Tax=Heterodera schachtii TaxID=97005 RepID=A0ABD2JPG7_HETSC